MAKGWSFGALVSALKGAAFLDVGTAASTVAAGDDSRIVNALQKGNNLNDVTNKATSRTNLELGTTNNVTFNQITAQAWVQAATFMQTVSYNITGGGTNLAAGQLNLGGSQAGYRTITFKDAAGAEAGSLYADPATKNIYLRAGADINNSVYITANGVGIQAGASNNFTITKGGNVLNGGLSVASGGVSVSNGLSANWISSTTYLSIGTTITAGGNIQAGNVVYSGAGASYLNTDGNIYGGVYGGWLTTWVFNNYVPRNVGWSDLSTYVCARYNGGASRNINDTVNGADLFAANCEGASFGTIMAGLYRCQGAATLTNDANRTTLWYRYA